MHGRHIFDSIMVASEVVNNIKARQNQGLVLKIDFEKAFDTIEWSFFLFHLLETLNFNKLCIDWLSAIFHSSRVSILVNGSPSKEFTPERGLRQGDPLSPLLFNLVGEVLHSMFERAEALGIFKGVLVGKNGFTISHLQYEDDIIVFVKNDTSSVLGVKRVLQYFHVLTDLKVSFQKSHLFGFHEDQNDIIRWASILDC